MCSGDIIQDLRYSTVSRGREADFPAEAEVVVDFREEAAAATEEADDEALEEEAEDEERTLWLFMMAMMMTGWTILELDGRIGQWAIK
jgi:hypothetical protein